MHAAQMHAREVPLEVQDADQPGVDSGETVRHHSWGSAGHRPAKRNLVCTHGAWGVGGRAGDLDLGAATWVTGVASFKRVHQRCFNV